MVSLKNFAVRLLLLATPLFSAAPAFAAAPDKLIIGVIPEVNLVKQMERYVPLSDYLDKKLGVDVEIKPLSNYGQMFEEMRDGKIDAGFFGSLVYGLTRARIGIEPLARPVNLNGKSRYTGILFVNRDAGIKKTADMKGRTIALVDPATSAGYLAQREYFAAHGINMDTELKIYWAGNHEAAIKAVLNRQADIGGAKDSVVASFRKENRVFDTAVAILNENPQKGLPENTLAVRKGMAPQQKAKLRTALLAMNHDAAGKMALAKLGARKFIATSDADYKPLYDWIKRLKIDLRSYPYKKDSK